MIWEGVSDSVDNVEGSNHDSFTADSRFHRANWVTQ